MKMPNCKEDEEMTITVLATITFADNQGDALATYLKVTAPLLESAGAKVTGIFDLNEFVVGTGKAKRVMFVDYPSRSAVDRVFNSPEYKALIPTRDKAFSTYEIAIAEQPAGVPF